MSSVYYPYIIRMSYVCHLYVIRMSSVFNPYAIFMSSVCHQYVICMSSVCHQYVTRISSTCHMYVICMSSICMSSVYHPYVSHMYVIIFHSNRRNSKYLIWTTRVPFQTINLSTFLHSWNIYCYDNLSNKLVKIDFSSRRAGALG